jgi:mutator protein MutT
MIFGMEEAKENAVRVTAAVIIKDNKVLICRRKLKDGSDGQWEFPGGKEETGETLQACLERELEEELSLRIKAGRELARHRHEAGGRTLDICFLQAEITSGTLELTVHSDAVWAKPEDLYTFDLLPADRAFAESFFKDFKTPNHETQRSRI